MRDILVFVVFLLLIAVVLPVGNAPVDAHKEAEAVPAPVSVLGAIGRGDGVCPLARQRRLANEGALSGEARELVRGLEEAEDVAPSGASAVRPDDTQSGQWALVILGVAFVLLLFGLDRIIASGGRR